MSDWTTSRIINIAFIHQIESQIPKAELEGTLHTIFLLWALQSMEAQAKKKPSLHKGHGSILQVHCLSSCVEENEESH